MEEALRRAEREGRAEALVEPEALGHWLLVAESSAEREGCLEVEAAPEAAPDGDTPDAVRCGEKEAEEAPLVVPPVPPPEVPVPSGTVRVGAAEAESLETEERAVGLTPLLAVVPAEVVGAAVLVGAASVRLTVPLGVGWASENELDGVEVEVGVDDNVPLEVPELVELAVLHREAGTVREKGALGPPVALRVILPETEAPPLRVPATLTVPSPLIETLACGSAGPLLRFPLKNSSGRSAVTIAAVSVMP